MVWRSFSLIYRSLTLSSSTLICFFFNFCSSFLLRSLSLLNRFSWSAFFSKTLWDYLHVLIISRALVCAMSSSFAAQVMVFPSVSTNSINRFLVYIISMVPQICTFYSDFFYFQSHFQLIWSIYSLIDYIRASQNRCDLTGQFKLSAYFELTRRHTLLEYQRPTSFGFPIQFILIFTPLHNSIPSKILKQNPNIKYQTNVFLRSFEYCRHHFSIIVVLFSCFIQSSSSIYVRIPSSGGLVPFSGLVLLQVEL